MKSTKTDAREVQRRTGASSPAGTRTRMATLEPSSSRPEARPSAERARPHFTSQEDGDKPSKENRQKYIFFIDEPIRPEAVPPLVDLYALRKESPQPRKIQEENKQKHIFYIDEPIRPEAVPPLVDLYALRKESPQPRKIQEENKQKHIFYIDEPIRPEAVPPLVDLYALRKESPQPRKIQEENKQKHIFYIDEPIRPEAVPPLVDLYALRKESPQPRKIQEENKQKHIFYIDEPIRPEAVPPLVDLYALRKESPQPRKIQEENKQKHIFYIDEPIRPKAVPPLVDRYALRKESPQPRKIQEENKQKHMFYIDEPIRPEAVPPLVDLYALRKESPQPRKIQEENKQKHIFYIDEPIRPEAVPPLVDLYALRKESPQPRKIQEENKQKHIFYIDEPIRPEAVPPLVDLYALRKESPQPRKIQEENKQKYIFYIDEPIRPEAEPPLVDPYALRKESPQPWKIQEENKQKHIFYIDEPIRREAEPPLVDPYALRKESPQPRKIQEQIYREEKISSREKHVSVSWEAGRQPATIRRTMNLEPYSSGQMGTSKPCAQRIESSFICREYGEEASTENTQKYYFLHDDSVRVEEVLSRARTSEHVKDRPRSRQIQEPLNFEETMSTREEKVSDLQEAESPAGRRARMVDVDPSSSREITTAQPCAEKIEFHFVYGQDEHSRKETQEYSEPREERGDWETMEEMRVVRPKEKMIRTTRQEDMTVMMEMENERELRMERGKDQEFMYEKWKKDRVDIERERGEQEEKKKVYLIYQDEEPCGGKVVRIQEFICKAQEITQPYPCQSTSIQEWQRTMPKPMTQPRPCSLSGPVAPRESRGRRHVVNVDELCFEDQSPQRFERVRTHQSERETMRMSEPAYRERREREPMVKRKPAMPEIQRMQWRTRARSPAGLGTEMVCLEPCPSREMTTERPCPERAVERFICWDYEHRPADDQMYEYVCTDESASDEETPPLVCPPRHFKGRPKTQRFREPIDYEEARGLRRDDDSVSWERPADEKFRKKRKRYEPPEPIGDAEYSGPVEEEGDLEPTDKTRVGRPTRAKAIGEPMEREVGKEPMREGVPRGPPKKQAATRATKEEIPYPKKDEGIREPPKGEPIREPLKAEVVRRPTGRAIQEPKPEEELVQKPEEEEEPKEEQVFIKPTEEPVDTRPVEIERIPEPRKVKSAEQPTEPEESKIEPEEPLKKEEEKPKKKGRRRKKRTNTMLKRATSFLLPDFMNRVMWSEGSDYFVTKMFIGAGIGGLAAAGLYFMLIDPLKIHDHHKIALLWALFAVCVFGWAISPLFRCACFLILPQVLGKEGRTFLFIFVMATIYAGPIANIEDNMEDVVASIGCTMELQINHTKMMWKVMLEPIKTIVAQLVGEGKNFNTDTEKIKEKFKEIKDEVMSNDAMDKNKEEKMERNLRQNSRDIGSSITQKLFEAKTKLRCEYVAEQAELRCREWFDKKHEDCMRTIWVPILNHLLCLPMRFKFLCKLVHLLTSWCKSKIPVEGNFGKTFDTIETNVGHLTEAFETDMTVKQEERPMLMGEKVDTAQLMEDMQTDVTEKKIRLLRVLLVVQVIMSLTILLVFISAFSYIALYNVDIRFDNIYITTYFRQIDARRRKEGNRWLLPLKKVEAKELIFPFQLAIRRCEVRAMITELMQCIPVTLFLIAVCLIDYLLTTILLIIRKHSIVDYTFKSEHQLKVDVGGEGMMARLLRKTIGALSSSSSTTVKSSNIKCVPNPVVMQAWDYFLVIWPLLCLIALCMLQVYVYRIRRAVAAIFFPKREKRRILFLYNELLRKRQYYINRQKKRVVLATRRNNVTEAGLVGKLIRRFPCLRVFNPLRCIVCNEKKNKNSVMCGNPECKAWYCPQCWVEMQRVCYACKPLEKDEFISGESDDENVRYAG